MDTRHFISIVLNTELDRLGAGKTTLENVNYVIDALERHSFVPEHKTFFPAMKQLATKVANGE